MKRGLLNIFLGFALAFLLANGMFAQTVPTGYTTAAYDTAGVVHMVTGDTVPVFALPDPYYHPNYNPFAATPDWTLTAGFTWTWTTADFTQINASQNYVELVSTGAGSEGGTTYSISVQENASATYSSCSGSSTTQDIVVYLAPTATMGGDASYEFCSGAGGGPASVAATISGGYQNFRLIWDLEIATLDSAGGSKEFWYDDEDGTGSSGTSKFAVNSGNGYTDDSPEAVAAKGAHDIKTVADYNVINNGTYDAVTVYTYRLQGINDQASRTGDYIALTGDNTTPEDFEYNSLSETITVTVYPAPVTGPIFHIPTNWAQ